MVPRDPCLCGTTHVRQSWSVCLKEYSRREYMSLPRSAYSTVASIWDPFSFPLRSLAPGKASCHVWGHLQAYREPHLTMWEPRSLADSQPRINTWVIPGVEDHCTKSADDSSPNWQPDCSLKRDHETESLSEATPTFLSSANCEMRSFLFYFFKLPNLGTTTSSMTTLYLQELSDKGERHLAFYFHLGQWLLVVQVSWKLRIW